LYLVFSIAHWAEIYGWPQHWVALNETIHPEGKKVGIQYVKHLQRNILYFGMQNTVLKTEVF